MQNFPTPVWFFNRLPKTLNENELQPFLNVSYQHIFTQVPSVSWPCCDKEALKAFAEGACATFSEAFQRPLLRLVAHCCWTEYALSKERESQRLRSTRSSEGSCTVKWCESKRWNVGGVWHCWKTPCSAFTSPCKVPMMQLLLCSLWDFDL